MQFFTSFHLNTKSLPKGLPSIILKSLYKQFQVIPITSYLHVVNLTPFLSRLYGEAQKFFFLSHLHLSIYMLVKNLIVRLGYFTI